MASTGSLPSLAPELLIEVIVFALGSTENEFCTIGLDAILRLPKFNNLEKVLLQNSEPDTLQGNIVPSVDVEGPIYGSSGTRKLRQAEANFLHRCQGASTVSYTIIDSLTNPY
jgi:hypothetical protein